MGGRYALHVALRHPDLVRRLVVVSATGGIDDPGERAARRDGDEVMAARVESEGVAAFVAWWLERPLFATLPPGAAALESRLGGTAAGLASSLRLAGTGTQEPFWSELRRLAMPVLVVAGSLDRPIWLTAGAWCQYRQERRPGRGPQAGHACHLEQPDAFLDIVLPFLDAASAGHQMRQRRPPAGPKASCSRPGRAPSTGSRPCPRPRPDQTDQAAIASGSGQERRQQRRRPPHRQHGGHAERHQHGGGIQLPGRGGPDAAPPGSVSRSPCRPGCRGGC